MPSWTVHPRDSFRALTSGAYFLMYNRPPSLPTPSKPPHHTCIRHSHTSDHAQPPSTTFHHHHAIYITLSSPLISFLRLPIRTTWGGCSAASAFPTDRPQFCRPVTRPHLGFLAPKIPPRDSDLLSSQPFIFRPFAHDTASPRPHFRPTDTRPCLVRSPASSYIARAF